MRRTPLPPIFLKVWASSHGQPWHGLPNALRKTLENENRFLTPEFNAVSGQRINEDVVAVIKNDMDSRSVRQIHIIIMGGNNIRSRGHATEVIPFFRSIIEYATNISGCFVVIVGLLPSPKTDIDSKKRFENASSLLKQLTFRYSQKSSFLNAAKFFLKELSEENSNVRGKVNETFFKDGIHLNNDGSEKLAKELRKHLVSLPNRKLR